MVSRDSILRFSFLLFIFHLRAAAPTVLAAAGAALGAPGLGHPPSPLMTKAPTLTINKPQLKISRTQKSRRSKDLLLLCLLKASQTIPFSYRRSLWQR
jgi:hypothetical protein